LLEVRPGIYARDRWTERLGPSSDSAKEFKRKRTCKEPEKNLWFFPETRRFFEGFEVLIPGSLCLFFQISGTGLVLQF
jgi:hypothetical protein